MLYIGYELKDTGPNESTITWHVGEKISRHFLSDRRKEILYVQANCDELMHIINNFPNLPYPKHQRVVMWYGEMAKFIAMNL